MRRFRILIAIIALAGCAVTEKQRARILAECPGSDSTSTKETIKYIRHDSIAYINSDPELLIIENPCDSVKPKIFHVKKKEHGISEDIVSDGKTITFTCKDDSFMTIIRGLNIERTVLKESFQEKLLMQNYDNQRTSIDGFYKWTSIFFFVCVALTGIGFGLRMSFQRKV